MMRRSPAQLAPRAAGASHFVLSHSLSHLPLFDRSCDDERKRAHACCSATPLYHVSMAVHVKNL